jgi:hypothetical protein
MSMFFATFGQSSPLSEYFVQIIADNEIQAQKGMVEAFGHNYSMIYRPDEYTEAIESWEYDFLVGIKVIDHAAPGDPSPDDHFEYKTFNELKEFQDIGEEAAV